MSALMKMQDMGKSTEITLRLPKAKAGAIGRAIDAILDAAGVKVHRVNETGEEIFSVAEVFPDAHPGLAIKGLRLREEMTQAEMADRLKIPQSHLSALERGVRPITVAMAKKIEKCFGMGYKAFL